MVWRFRDFKRKSEYFELFVLLELRKENQKEGEIVSDTERIQNFYVHIEAAAEWTCHLLCLLLIIDLCMLSILLRLLS